MWFTAPTSHTDSDMYSFDVNEKMAEKTYEKVVWTYDRIFKQLDLPIAKGWILIMY